MIAQFAVSLLAGCVFSPPECADGYQRDTMGNCQDVEHDEGSDTGGMVIEGAFMGAITIDVGADVGGEVLSDVCEGDVGIDVSDGLIAGTLFCNFQDAFDAVLQGQTFEGSLSGQIDDENAATGDLTLDLALFGVLDAVWLGMASTEQIGGSFDGDMSVDFAGQSVPVVYSGSFEAAP